MPIEYFAGLQFTAQEVVTIYTTLFVGASVAVGLVLFLITKIYNKFNKHKVKSFGLFKSLLYGGLTVLLGAVFFLIIPTMIRDNNWRNKQQECAQTVGYSSPADDNSSFATFQQQSAYDACLGN